MHATVVHECIPFINECFTTHTRSHKVDISAFFPCHLSCSCRYHRPYMRLSYNVLINIGLGLVSSTYRANLYRWVMFCTTRGYQKVLSLTWKEPEIWIYSALFFNVVPFQLHTLVPSSFPVINTRSVEVNILVP